MKFISKQKNLSGKIILLRSDLNTEDLEKSYRLKRSLETPKWLRKQGAIVVMVAHRDRPHGHVDPRLSLKEVSKYLKNQFKDRFFFLSDWDIRSMREKIHKAKKGDIFLLENLRFHRGEENNDKTFAHQLSSLANIYVNDAFSVSHRAHASISAITKYLPSYAGLLFQEELEALSQSIKRPLVVILGGGKATDKFAVVENLYPKAKAFLIGGVLANTFLVARGEDVADSIVDYPLISKLKKHLKKKKIIMPLDYVRNSQGKILDIGPKTQKEFSKILKRAKTIIWSGPMGQFEDPRYRKGSVQIAKNIANSDAFTIIGGGETGDLISSLRLGKKVSFLSTAGSAMLAYLAGDKMPGIKALK